MYCVNVSVFLFLRDACSVRTTARGVEWCRVVDVEFCMVEGRPQMQLRVVL